MFSSRLFDSSYLNGFASSHSRISGLRSLRPSFRMIPRFALSCIAYRFASASALVTSLRFNSLSSESLYFFSNSSDLSCVNVIDFTAPLTSFSNASMCFSAGVFGLFSSCTSGFASVVVSGAVAGLTAGVAAGVVAGAVSVGAGAVVVSCGASATTPSFWLRR